MPRGKISEELDDRLYEKAMFGQAGNANYLGDPQVVGGLVADYCMLVREMLVNRARDLMTKEAFKEDLIELRDHMATIFEGRDPQFTALAGWPSELNARLRVELSSYWAEHHAENDENPIKCLFSWLAWAVSDSIQRSNGDPDMEGVYLSTHTGQAIRLLLGTDRRA